MHGERGQHGARINLEEIPCKDCDATYGYVTNNLQSCNCDKAFEILNSMNALSSTTAPGATYSYTSSTDSNKSSSKCPNELVSHETITHTYVSDTAPGIKTTISYKCPLACDTSASNNFWSNVAGGAPATYVRTQPSGGYGWENAANPGTSNQGFYKISDDKLYSTFTASTLWCYATSCTEDLIDEYDAPQPGADGTDGEDGLPGNQGTTATANTYFIFNDPSTTRGGVGYKRDLLGTEDEYNVQQVKLVPNPAHATISLHLDEDLMQNGGTLQITDMLGKVMYMQDVHRGISILPVNISRLVTGTYILTVQNGSSVHRLRFVKQ